METSLIPQRTDEWFTARLGRATASRAADILAKIKSGEAATRRQYRAQLVVERLVGKPYEHYVNEAMQHGIDQEPFAIMSYEATTGNIVQPVGFIQHPELMAGASPDGEIGEDGLLEAKCPTTAEHIDALLNGMSPKHIPQVQFQMWITGRAYVQFVSYDPRMPERMQLYVQRVVRDDKYILTLEAEVIVFLKEVDAMVERLLKRTA